jgi:hypothetical protein
LLLVSLLVLIYKINKGMRKNEVHARQNENAGKPRDTMHRGFPIALPFRMRREFNLCDSLACGA